jgi:hypothetical protein
MHVFRQVLEDLHLQAVAKSIYIGVTSEQNANIILAEIDLMTFVRNLVDNAIRYTPAGGQIHPSVGAGEEGVIVQVESLRAGWRYCCGIAWALHLPCMQARFFRPCTPGPGLAASHAAA